MGKKVTFGFTDGVIDIVVELREGQQLEAQDASAVLIRDMDNDGE